MRLLKMFGLAALVAAAAMAFVGTGTAAATTTVVCTENKTPCPPEKILEQGTHNTNTGALIKAVAQDPQLKVYEDLNQTTIKNELTCEKSAVEGRYQEKGTQEAPQHKGEIKELNFTNCSVKGLAGSTCTVTVLQLPWQTLLTQTENQDGTLTVYEQATNGQPGARVVCKVSIFTVVDCTYKVQETDAQVPGKEVGHMKVKGSVQPEPMIIEANQLPLKALNGAGETCPGEGQAKWDAVYKVTEPNNGQLWVSQQEP